MTGARKRYKAAHRKHREFPNFRRAVDGFCFDKHGNYAAASLNHDATPREFHAKLLNRGGLKKCRRFYIARARAIRLSGYKTIHVQVKL